MKEAKHIAINEAKWDKWASTLDEKGKWNDYLRKAQSDVIELLERITSSIILFAPIHFIIIFIHIKH